MTTPITLDQLRRNNSRFCAVCCGSRCRGASASNQHLLLLAPWLCFIFRLQLCIHSIGLPESAKVSPPSAVVVGGAQLQGLGNHS